MSILCHCLWMCYFRKIAAPSIVLHQDPNWQDMLADELQRAEEELNNWSLSGRSKNPGRLVSEVLLQVPVLRSLDCRFEQLS